VQQNSPTAFAVCSREINATSNYADSEDWQTKFTKNTVKTKQSVRDTFTELLMLSARHEMSAAAMKYRH